MIDEDFGAEARRRADGQWSLVSVRAHGPGAVVTPFAARERLAQPTARTIQVAPTEHILLAPTLLELVNHSCEPRVLFDVVHFELRALRAIQAGDEITCFYPSTEWTMAQPFHCHCGARDCIGLVRGAADLPAEQLLRHPLSPVVRAHLEERQGGLRRS